MPLQILNLGTKNRGEALTEVVNYFTDRGYKVVDSDQMRPWGFYLYFDVKQTEKFIKDFFSDVSLSGLDTSLPLQPKVLAFEPGKRLSWQYHYRRSEIWRCITNKCRVWQSRDDTEPKPKIIKFGESLISQSGIRHRAGGTDEWGAVVEIWQHTDKNNLSDEEDIVRLQDDYGRK